MKASLRWKGDKVLQADFRKLIKIAENPKRALHKIGIHMIKATTLNLMSEGTRIGETWAPLSEKYARVRYAIGYTAGTLQKIGMLKGSITYQVPDKSSVRWSYGSTAPYGMYHISQKKPRTKIPYRQFVGMAQADKKKIVKIMQDEIGRDIKRVF